MKIQFLADRTWACCGEKTVVSKGDVLEVREDLAQLFIKDKSAKKHTVKKKTTK